MMYMDRQGRPCADLTHEGKDVVEPLYHRGWGNGRGKERYIALSNLDTVLHGGG